jgi:hypothetical protein
MPISTIDSKGLTSPLTSGVTTNTITSAAATALTLQSAGTTAVTINTSQNVGIGVTTPSPWSLGKGLEVGFAGNGLNATRQAEFNINCNAYYDGTWRYGGTGKAFVIQVSDGTFNTLLSAASGSAGGAISWTTGPSIPNDGHFIVAGSNSAWLTVNPNLGATEGTALGYFYGSGSGDMLFQSMNSGGGSATNAGIKMGMNSVTSRSINARGTVNANGADYAEYMTKCSNFTVAKGDVVGINANGKLTNVFADAISFVVKSTDPSYVGGDTWGSPEALGLAELRPLDQSASDEVKAKYAQDKTVMDTALETARQLVDRIAFSGQVPVNVTGTTAGQYIIPVNDNGSIKGQAVSNPTFEQYQIAVGKVIAIESDGRAKIIVKVA